MADKSNLTRVRLQKDLYIVKRVTRWDAERCTCGVRKKSSLGTSDGEEAAKRLPATYSGCPRSLGLGERV